MNGFDPVPLSIPSASTFSACSQTAAPSFSGAAVFIYPKTNRGLGQTQAVSLSIRCISGPFIPPKVWYRTNCPLRTATFLFSAKDIGDPAVHGFPAGRLLVSRKQRLGQNQNRVPGFRHDLFAPGGYKAVCKIAGNGHKCVAHFLWRPFRILPPARHRRYKTPPVGQNPRCGSPGPLGQPPASLAYSSAFSPFSCARIPSRVRSHT